MKDQKLVVDMLYDPNYFYKAGFNICEGVKR